MRHQFEAWNSLTHSLKVGKYGPEKTPYLDTFHTVFFLYEDWPNAAKYFAFS